jgi:nitroimidazol reductase NimA-like FMN-containing flavoprotein (pyridoxamine 5'-phosphate oxidase superfamily)
LELKLRRSDREVTGLRNILAILDACEILHIGLCLDDKPYIVPMNFAFEQIGEEVRIYLHSASEGKKLDIIAKNNNVCFEADCAYTILPADEACDWSAEFQSVVGEGIITIITDEARKTYALDVFMQRYGFQGKPQYSPQQLSAVTVLQITVRSMTGKQKFPPKKTHVPP